MDKIIENKNIIKQYKEQIPQRDYELMNLYLTYLERTVEKELEHEEYTNFNRRLQSYCEKMRKKSRKCNCSPTEICYSSSEKRLKNCRNFNAFTTMNPAINLLYDVGITFTLEKDMKILDDEREYEFSKINIMNHIMLLKSFENENKIFIVISLIKYCMKNLYTLILDKNISKLVNAIWDNYCSNGVFLQLLMTANINPIEIKENIAFTLRD